jgi:hypothetical protein
MAPTDPVRDRSSGLDPFRGVLRDVKELWAWAAGAAAVPFLANLAALAPPWPPAIVYLTAIIELIALILAFQFLKKARVRTINRVLAVSAAILFLSSILYLGLLSEFSYQIPGAKLTAVKGFVCTAEAIAAFAGKCPWLGETELKQAEWFAPHLWTSWSITIMRVLLASVWLLAFMMLTTVLGSFVVHQRRFAPRNGGGRARARARLE